MSGPLRLAIIVALIAYFATFAWYGQEWGRHEWPSQDSVYMRAANAFMLGVIPGIIVLATCAGIAAICMWIWNGFRQ